MEGTGLGFRPSSAGGARGQGHSLVTGLFYTGNLGFSVLVRYRAVPVADVKLPTRNPMRGSEPPNAFSTETRAGVAAGHWRLWIRRENKIPG